MRLRFVLPLSLLVLAAGCAPWQAPPTGADPLAAVRGHDAYGLVVAVQPEPAPDMRYSTICANSDTDCQVVTGEAGTYQYAKVQLSGQVTIDRAIVSKGLSNVGDIVRLSIPYDRTILPTSVERAAKAADRKPDRCDWADGSPQEKTGGVVCKGWSYRQLDGARRG